MEWNRKINCSLEVNFHWNRLWFPSPANEFDVKPMNGSSRYTLCKALSYVTMSNAFSRSSATVLFYFFDLDTFQLHLIEHSKNMIFIERCGVLIAGRWRFGRGFRCRSSIRSVPQTWLFNNNDHIKIINDLTRSLHRFYTQAVYTCTAVLGQFYVQIVHCTQHQQVRCVLSTHSHLSYELKIKNS